ncbi:MAG: NERD domain-containing protein, partial [Betaproteobacteria bacterium]|nr:NERD domain-containing protein [Betaproteobacteria bacterium]
MAHLFPTLPLLPGNKAGERTELALLQTLQASLSDAYTLFHSVDWSRGSGLQEQHGEIDIVVLNQAGDVLLIEVKSGEVTFAPNGIYKAYDHQVKDVAAQVKRQYGAMRSRLEAAGLAVRVFTLLVLPDMQVQAETALWPRSRIVDSKEVADVGARIAEMLG